MGQARQPQKYSSKNRPYNRRRRRRRRRWGIFGIPFSTLLAAAALIAAVVVVCFITMGKSEKIKSGEGNIKTMLAGQADQKAEQNDTTPAKHIPLIMIDSGHGGNDPGCIKERAEGDIYEKDINLAISKKLKEILEEKGFRVIMTRSGDTHLSLDERVALSGEKGPDIFVSIHQNTLENDTKTNGIETHYYDNPGLDSRALAETVQRFVVQSTAAKDRGTCSDRDLYVLKNNTVSACLVETGFLSAAEEGNKLLDSGYQEKLAKGIAEGIQNYLQTKEKK